MGWAFPKIREGERMTERETEGYREQERGRERKGEQETDVLTKRKAWERKVRKRDEGSASRGPDLSGESPDSLKEEGTSKTAGHLGE